MTAEEATLAETLHSSSSGAPSEERSASCSPVLVLDRQAAVDEPLPRILRLPALPRAQR